MSVNKIIEIMGDSSEGWEAAAAEAVAEASKTVKNIRSVWMLEEDKAEVIEVEITPVAPAADRAVKDLGFPRGAIIATLVRGDDIIIPRGKDMLNPGDIAIVFTHPKNVSNIVKILTGR